MVQLNGLILHSQDSPLYGGMDSQQVIPRVMLICGRNISTNMPGPRNGIQVMSHLYGEHQENQDQKVSLKLILVTAGSLLEHQLLLKILIESRELSGTIVTIRMEPLDSISGPRIDGMQSTLMINSQFTVQEAEELVL